MAVISSGNHPKALWPGIHRWWGRRYNEYPALYPAMFTTQNSRKSYEEDVKVTGFGLAPVKSEGTGVTYDSEVQGETTRYTNTAYALGYIVTYEEQADNLYAEVSKRRSAALAFSMRQTKETVAANVYNRATNAAFTGGDGVPLLSNAHPTTIGNQSNVLPTPADLSETALEDITILIRKAVNDRGLRIQLQSRLLVLPPDLEFEGARILKSVQQNDTANNAINALRATGTFPNGMHVNPFLTDKDRWYVRTMCPSGLTNFERERISFSTDNDFDTKNLKASCYERYVFGWTDWRDLYGSPGS